MIENMSKEKGGELSEEDLEQLWALLFADDQKIASSIRDNEDRKKLQLVLDKIYEWITVNRMSINSEKTYCLRFGKTKKEESPMKVKVPLQLQCTYSKD